MVVVGVLVVIGCSSTKTVIIRKTVTPAPAVVTVPATPAAAPVYSDTQACQGFHDATTIGIPPGAAPPGTDTMTWLQSQVGQAEPRLQSALNAFIQPWLAVTPDLATINRSTRIIKRLCRAAGVSG